MSKVGTVAFSITEASSAQGEGNQVDLGPYSTTASPGDFSVANYAKGGTALSPVDSNPIYLVVEPVPQTSGSAPAVSGFTGDVGCAVSDANPSFIPVIPTVSENNNTWTVALILTGNAAPVNIGWV